MANAEVLTFARTEAYSSQLAGQFHQLRMAGELTNFTIHCSNKTFHCHKVILAACSPVLKAMITNDMVESSKQEVTLHNIPPPVMQLLLEYMYTGEGNVPNEQLLLTVEACDYLELTELKERCLAQATTVFKPANVISWHKLAETLNLHQLKSKCSEILSTSLPEVSKSAEFLDLSFSELSSYMNDVMETDVDCDDLLEAIMDWLDHKPDPRCGHMEDLLLKMDVTRCSIECLESQSNKHRTLLESNMAGYRIVMHSVMQIAKGGVVRKKRGKNQRSKSVMLVVPGHTPVPFKVCWTFDPSIGFEELCEINECSAWHSVCELPGGFALTGGKTAPNDRLCNVFDLATKSWKRLEALKIPRWAHGSIFMNKKIFLFGGVTSDNPSSSVHSLQLNGGTWTEEPDILFGVGYPEVAIASDKIFLLDVYSTNQLLQLDVEKMTWCERARFPVTSSSRGAKMLSVQGQLLVAGGRNKTSGGYNPFTDTWWTGATPSLEHHYGALVHHGQKLYLIGGSNEDRVEEYDLDTKAWSVRDVKVPEKLWNLRAVSI